MTDRSWRFAPFLAWFGVAAVALAFRVPLAIDETRYLTVAWEMYSRGDWLLPHLNGSLYAHKPPLLFWLIAGGWKLAGVSAWWPRLVPLLAGLAGMAAAWRLAGRLWPQVEGAGALAASMTGGMLVWTATGTVIMFDMLLAACVLAGMLGLAAAGAGARRGWPLFGLGLGLGILAKGPVALLHLGLPALLGPWWSERARTGRRTWYLGLVTGLGLAAVISLAWVLPAVFAGGPGYAHTILWTQTADRLANSFAHPRTWWWYLPLLPALFLPWTLWPPALRAIRDGVRGLDAGAKFCLAWAVPVFLAFCVVSGKQPQYLLPVMPALALLAARGMATGYAMSYRGARTLALAPALALALVMSSAVWPGWDYGGWLEDVNPAWTVALWLVLGWAILPFRVTALEGTARLSVAMMLSLSIAAAGLLGSAAGRAYGVGPAAREVAALQARGITVAYLGDYHGQLGFAGRLRRPLPELHGPADVRTLLAREPAAEVLVESRDNPLGAAPQLPSSVMAYRRGYWSLWRAEQLAGHPGILDVIGARGQPEQAESME